MSWLFSSKTVTGHCLCKDIKVEIDCEALNDRSNTSLYCHCENCQRAGGGLGSLDLMLPNEKVHLIDEKSLIRKYDDTNTDSNQVVERYFCSQCGSPIYSKSPKSKPETTIIKLSLFVGEVNQLLCPTFEVYCKQMMDWEKKIEGAKHFDKAME